jgi:hypothetical protein
MLPGEVGIAEGHADILVAQQTHDGLQVDPVHDQVAGEGGSQIVEAKVFDDGLATSRVERTFHLIVGLASSVAKDIVRVQVAGRVLELSQQRLIDGDHVGLIILRLPHDDRLRREIDILPLQP